MLHESESGEAMSERGWAIAAAVAVLALAVLGYAGVALPAWMISAVAGAILIGLLVWAPMELYGIHRQMRRQTEILETHTKLLASIANDIAERRQAP